MFEKKQIWIVSEFYYPVLTSTGYYITEIAEFLAENGKNINVICTNSTYNHNVEHEFLKKEYRNGVIIHRIKSYSTDKSNFVKRAFNLSYSSIRLFFKLLFSVHKNDEILVVTNPAFLIVLMPLVKFLKGVQYKILVHDIFPENLAAIGKISENQFQFKILKRIFDFSYSNAELCIALGRDMREVLSGKIGRSTGIEIITNWSDTNEVEALNKSQTNLIKKLKLQNKFIFQFAGNLGNLQGIENILEAIKLVNNSEIHFLFIGSGTLENKIKKFIESNKQNNLTLLGFQKRENQNDFLNACDIGIVTLSNGMFGLGVPSKSYNIMASGKPLLVIADEKSEIGLCVKEHRIGWVVNPDDPVTLSEEFSRIYYECVSNGGPDISNPREIALNYFSKEKVLKKYFNLFN